MTTLRYRARVMVDELAVGECTIHRASASGPARWWLLWASVPRDTDGEPEWIGVPVAPGGSYTEKGPGGRTWGLTKTGDDVWTISPSINVLGDRDAVTGEHGPSIWHHPPTIEGVPDDEPWARGEPP